MQTKIDYYATSKKESIQQSFVEYSADFINFGKTIEYAQVIRYHETSFQDSVIDPFGAMSYQFNYLQVATEKAQKTQIDSKEAKFEV